MAQKGRPKKLTTPVLNEPQTVRINDLDVLYKQLASMKETVNFTLRHIGMIDECGTIAEAAFKAGRVYGPLDQLNDALEEMLDHIYETNGFDHWEDLSDN